MAAASRRRRRTGFCRGPRAGCVYGSHRAALWQAGFRNVTCAMANHQQCDGRARTVYVTLDADSNGSGRQAAHWVAGRLREEGLNACRVSLPDGHDPNSFFVAGGSAQEFQHLLEGACL